MTYEHIVETITRILREHLEADTNNIQPDSSLGNDLGLDSLDYVELVMALEDEFEIEINDDESENIQTLAQVARLVFEKVS